MPSYETLLITALALISINVAVLVISMPIRFVAKVNESRSPVADQLSQLPSQRWRGRYASLRACAPQKIRKAPNLKLATNWIGKVISLYKIRKVYLANFELIRSTNDIRRETATLFSQIQALLALERKLGLHDALPPMRGWAGSPDFLLKVAEEALRRKPQTVLECSSGVSTVVLARCVQLNGTGHVYSLENSPEYAIKTRVLLEQHGLADWATVLDAPLVTQFTQTPWYDESAIPAELMAIDMLVVDGPPASTAPLARYHALPRLHPRMATYCTVMLDDADRSDEVEILKRWKQEFPNFEQTHLACEKGLVQLSRKTVIS